MKTRDKYFNIENALIFIKKFKNIKFMKTRDKNQR